MLLLIIYSFWKLIKGEINNKTEIEKSTIKAEKFFSKLKILKPISQQLIEKLDTEKNQKHTKKTNDIDDLNNTIKFTKWIFIEYYVQQLQDTRSF